ncbi:hypothetical protein IMSAG250_00593 [Clostridiales bacterium]|nr:hypothetical protein IMSAG250_00593 [Clostridiales bacterium]
MTVGQVMQAYKDKKHSPCPITEKLIKAGYQQMRGGYIKTAKKKNEIVDYKQALPTQYWHLFESYFKSDKITENTPFTKRIVCGELIFWMAEVLDCVDKKELETLCDEIIINPIPCEKEPRFNKNEQPLYCRAKWNKAIQDLCFDKIVEKVENICVE